MIPIGTEISVATPVITRVPTIAWLAPPPSPTTPRLVSLKKAQSKRLRPLLTTVHSSEINGESASAKVEMIARVTRRSFALRGPSTARDQE